MAEIAESEGAGPDDRARLYTAIEKAYVEDRWAEVLDQGEALLARLDEHDRQLRQRLQLLMAHTHLYGYGERDLAEDLYRAVLASQADASLRQIAHQGLQQCDQPLDREADLRSAKPVDERENRQAEARQEESSSLHRVGNPLEDGNGPVPHGSPEGQRSQGSGPDPVMPWRTSDSAAAATTPSRGASLYADWNPDPVDQARAVSLQPDVIDEPELIEVHQADPTLAEEIELMQAGSPDNRASVTSELGEMEPQKDPGFEEDPELLAGLLRVVIR